MLICFLDGHQFLCTIYLLPASDPKEADIIWTSMQIDEDTRKATGITDKQYVNQFPFEACLVMKHHLAETIEKVNIETNSYDIYMCVCARECIY